MLTEDTLLNDQKTLTSTGSSITRILYSSATNVEDVSTELELSDYVLGEPYETGSTFTITNIDITPLSSNEISPNNRYFVIRVTWSDRQTFDENWSVQLNTNREHITSVDMPSQQIHAPSWDNTGTGIGINSDGTSEGVDVLRPEMIISCVKRYNLFADIPWGYIKTYTYPAPSMNNNLVNWGTNFQFAPGELLFVGAEAQRQDIIWSVNFKFLAKPWETYQVSIDGYAYTIGNVATGGYNVAAKPFDCIWKKDKKVSTTIEEKKILQTQLQSIHVATVYQVNDFSLLGLTGPQTTYVPV